MVNVIAEDHLQELYQEYDTPLRTLEELCQLRPILYFPFYKSVSGIIRTCLPCLNMSGII